MRSKRQQISISYHPQAGARPVLLTLAHRQLEKSSPTPLISSRDHATYSIPVDVLRVIDPTGEMTKGIKALSVTYRKASTT